MLYNEKVNIAGVEFKNPVITASGTFGLGKEFEEFYPLSILGGVCCKAVTEKPRHGNPVPRATETPSGMLNAVGLQNAGLEAFLGVLPELTGKDTVIIANAAGSTKEEYLRVAERLSNSSVHMVELNISCPNVKEGGISFGVYPDRIEDIVGAVRAVLKKPLIVKLSPNVASIADNARAAEAAGADAVSLINTITGMAIDYKTRKPILANVTGGLSGPAIKPVALRMVWECYKAVKIPIIGMGGITAYTDVLEFIIAGAAAVQVGTANLSDPYASKEIVENLTKYLKENDLDINELKGSLEI